MLHRIFLAINLPENIKKELNARQKNISSMFASFGHPDPIRWTKYDNLHITLVFLGNTSDAEIPEIFKTIEGMVPESSSFAIRLESIIYAPPKKMPPRMVWAQGENNGNLGSLHRKLEDSLLSVPGKNPEIKQKRAYRPHITLGRIRQWDFKKIDAEERPDIREGLDLTFEVNSVEVMESMLKKTGAEYSILKSFSLN